MERDEPIIAAILARWEQGDRPVESQHVYTDLVAQGLVPPDGALYDLLSRLDQQGWVVIFHPPTGAGYERHGNASITWIGPQWLRHRV